MQETPLVRAPLRDPYNKRKCLACFTDFVPTNSQQRHCGAPCLPRKSRKIKKANAGIFRKGKPGSTIWYCIVCNEPYYPTHSRQKRCDKHVIKRSTRRFNNTLTELNFEYVELCELIDCLHPYINATPAISPQPANWPATWQWDTFWILDTYKRAITRRSNIEFKLDSLKGKGYERHL